MMSRAAFKIPAAVLLATVLASCGSSSNPNSGSGAAVGGFGRCDVAAAPTSAHLAVSADDTLTLAGVLPRPIYFEGTSVDTINGGYEYCLVANIAQRAGLRNLRLTNTSFDALVAGRMTGYDLAAGEIFATPERAQHVNFSASYYHSATGVMVRSGTDLTAETLRNVKIGVFLGSIQDGWVRNTLKPKTPARTYESTVDMFTALQASQVDAVLVDAEIELPAAASSHGKTGVIAQIPALGGDYSLVLPMGSSNTEPVNRILAAMKQDGTLDQLSQRWLLPAFGGVDPTALPNWSY
ncbi:substrate-binding periplasmic protein [Nocardia sp. CA-107356]|uniref:substrate-binding periplasmic protein n=1 Tax=Nocardia sp. CA-107356 TaxID=3239972 RepID=UPI003D8B64F5